jgi:hypothetical protein
MIINEIRIYNYKNIVKILSLYEAKINDVKYISKINIY